MMRRYLLSIVVSIVLVPLTVYAAFDERLWEMYADIKPAGQLKKGLVGISLQSLQRSGDIASFADLRVVDGRKREIPYKIVSKRSEKLVELIGTRLRNSSITKDGQTYVEVIVEGKNLNYDMIELDIPETRYFRKVEILGSSDGKSWNSIRKDAVIFDSPKDVPVRHTRIGIPASDYPNLVVKIQNGGENPVSVSAVKLYNERDYMAEYQPVPVVMGNSERRAGERITTVPFRLQNPYPVSRLRIYTPESNFYRKVDVECRQNGGQWYRCAEGSIYSLTLNGSSEQRIYFDVPDITASDLRLVIHDLDSPPLKISSVSAEGFRRTLVFDYDPTDNYYLFWGNPKAAEPVYDVAALLSGDRRLDTLPMLTITGGAPNRLFAGADARLPWTERYRYLLSSIVVLGIIGLLAMQYRLFRQPKA